MKRRKVRPLRDSSKLLDRLEETKRRSVSVRQIYNVGQWDAYSSVIYSYIYHKQKKKTLFPQAGIWKLDFLFFKKEREWRWTGASIRWGDASVTRSILSRFASNVYSSTLRRFFPPRPVDSKPRTAETLEVCCCYRCCCQSRLDKKSLKNNPLDKQCWWWDKISQLCVVTCSSTSLVWFMLHSLFFSLFFTCKHVACGCAALCSSHLLWRGGGKGSAFSSSFFWGFLIHEIDDFDRFNSWPNADPGCVNGLNHRYVYVLLALPCFDPALTWHPTLPVPHLRAFVGIIQIRAPVLP